MYALNINNDPTRTPPRKRHKKRPELVVPNVLQSLMQPQPPRISPFLRNYLANPPVAKETPLQASTAPLTSDTTTRKRGYFYYKWACEQHKPYKIWEASRLWFEIKDDFETRKGINQKRQQKRNLITTTLLAFTELEWAKLETRQDILERRVIPIHADHFIGEDDRLIFVRLPSTLGGRLYKEKPVLKFDESLTEEERIAQVVEFSSLAQKQYDESQPFPPSHYRCHNCGKPGHWRKNCNQGRRMATKGIPKTFLQTRREDVEVGDNVYVDDQGRAVEVRVKKQRLY